MDSINFSCYLIAPKLPLNKLVEFFKMHRHLSWEEYIVLKGMHLEPILKYATEHKQVYLFEFGCVTFVNFSHAEIHVFIDYLDVTFIIWDI